jgi:hypothetical protein
VARNKRPGERESKSRALGLRKLTRAARVNVTGNRVVDGYKFHGHRGAFERDRRKGLALAAAGHGVVRITWRQLAYEELFLAAHLGQALANGS